MKKIISLSITLFFFNNFCKAQTPISIPDTISGNNINLTIADSNHQFYAGFKTNTIGYNGSYLGPTIIINKGQNITLNVHNKLNDTTTTHWHGLHVAANNDGSPHNPIMAKSTWSPSFKSMDKAATYWYHPHIHMKTMKQVLKGAAGLIIVRDSEEKALVLPRKYGVDDFPLICQWKTFDTITKQIVMDDQLDNVTMVNGNMNGYLNVPAQMVRFRILNGSSHRFFYFALNDNRTFYQIAGDESLLNAPIAMTKLMLSPGERAEIIINFAEQIGNTYYLKQLGKSLPSNYPGGPRGGMGGTSGKLDNTDFNIMQFNVIASTNDKITTLPSSLIINDLPIAVGASTKDFVLRGLPQMSNTNFTINGTQYDEKAMNFTTKQDSIMIWNITNNSSMPHPWHIHGNHFFIQSINGATPPDNMKGRKDVVVVPPQNGNVKLIMKYSDFSDASMPYMYHCHINSHEDNGMMGQFIVNSNSSTGIKNVSINNSIKIYPNPSNTNWTIIGYNDNLDETSISLFNNLGQLTYQKTILKGLFIETIQNDNLKSGIYYLQITGITKTIKLIKN